MPRKLLGSLPDELRCTATAKSGERCRQPHIAGATVCKTHGGSVKRVKAAAERRVAEAKVQTKALKLLEKEQGITAVTDPVKVLCELAGEALAFKDVLAAHIQELRQMRFTDDKGAEQLRAEVALYERALDRSEKFASNLAKLGIAERLTQVEEGRESLAALSPGDLAQACAVLYRQSDEFRTAFDAQMGRIVIDAEPISAPNRAISHTDEDGGGVVEFRP